MLGFDLFPAKVFQCSWGMSYPDYSVMSGMVSSSLSCSSCPVHAGMFWPPSALLLFLFCLLWLSCLGCPILAFFLSSFVPKLSYLSCHVLIVLSYLLCPVCSALIFLPCSVCPAFFLHSRLKKGVIIYERKKSFSRELKVSVELREKKI
jgi:hypothetical protein